MNYDALAGQAPFTIRPCWQYHWGAVVAKQGDDRIIFENYARNEEDGTAVTTAGHRGFFEMYQVPSRNENRDEVLNNTWHRTWRRTGFANPLTIAVRRVQ